MCGLPVHCNKSPRKDIGQIRTCMSFYRAIPVRMAAAEDQVLLHLELGLLSINSLLFIFCNDRIIVYNFQGRSSEEVVERENYGPCLYSWF